MSEESRTALPEFLPVEPAICETGVEKPVRWTPEQYLALVPKSKRDKISKSVARIRRWLGYGRFSTLKQEMDSLSRQWKSVAPHWERDGHSLVEWVTDAGCTGTTSHGRAGLARVMAIIRAGEADALVVESIDRLYRNVGQLMLMYEEMVECDVELWDATQGKLNWIQVYVLGLAAQLGRERLLEQTAGGRVEKILDGRIFSAPIFGYRRHAHKGKLRVVDDDLRAVVIWIFERIAAGATCYRVAQDLNAKYPGPRPGARTPVEGPRKPPFDEKFVRRLIENELYMGLSRFNRSKCKRDFKTRQVKGAKSTPLAKQLFVEVKHLRIVSTRLWAEANARLAERNPGVGNGGKRVGPFSSKLFCECGSRMKRMGPTDRKYLRCEAALSAGPQSCRAHGGLPLAWVEGELLARIAAEVRDSGSDARLRAHVETVVSEAKRRLETQRKEKVAKLAAVERDLKRLFDETEVIGYSNAWLAVSREQLCLEQEGLKSELGRRIDLSPYDAILADLKGLDDAVAEMSKRLPFRVASAEDQELLAVISESVRDVRVLQTETPGVVRFAMRLRCGEAVEQPVDDPQLSLPLLDERPDEYLVEFEAMPDAGAPDRRAAKAEALAEERILTAETGEHDVPARVWKVVKPLVGDVDFGVGDMEVAPRRVFDAVFFALRTGTDWTKLPERYGAPTAVFRILHRMARRGTLDPVLEAIEAQLPDVAAGLDFSRLRNSRFPRSRAAMAPGRGAEAVKLGPRHAAELEAAAEKPGIDPMERARMLAVAALIDGASQKDVMAKFKYSRSYVGLLLATYRTEDIAGLRSKGWNVPKSVLTAEVFDDLRKFISKGFDPDRPHRPLTLTRVKEFLLVEKDIEMSIEYLGKCLNEKGISLREAIAAARLAA